MERSLKDGLKFKLIEFAAKIIQNLSPESNGFLIRRITKAVDICDVGSSFHNKMGIVIQGPLSDKDKTESVLKFAHDLISHDFVNHVVISTWKNICTSEMQSVDKLSVVLSDDIGFANNLERQIYTSFRGIEELPEDINQVIKMRVDQRISISGVAVIAKLLENEKFKDKLCFTTLNSYIYRIFGLSDMLVAGSRSNMKLFWNYEDNDFKFNVKSGVISLTNDSWVSKRVNLWYESFLNIRFAYYKDFVLGIDPWEDYLKYVKEHTVIIDSEFIDQKWFKLKSPFDGVTARSIYNSQVKNDDIEFTQSLWFAIAEGLYNPVFKDYDLLPYHREI